MIITPACKYFEVFGEELGWGSVVDICCLDAMHDALTSIISTREQKGGMVKC